MARKNFLLTIAYEGTHFRGWQEQNSAHEAEMPSLATTIRTAISQATGGEHDFEFHGSGRTDAGVHARAQTAHLRLATRLAPETLRRAINSLIPDAIRILAIREVSADLHAQKSTKRKTYRYFLTVPNRRETVPSAFLSRWTWYVPYELDFAAMEKTVTGFTGKHDFAAFRNSGSQAKTTIRELYEASLIQHEIRRDPLRLPWDLSPEDGLDLWEMRFVGKGFLKQMVRNLVGCAVAVGRGKISSRESQEIMRSLARNPLVPTAPAQGLFLDSVEY